MQPVGNIKYLVRHCYIVAGDAAAEAAVAASHTTKERKLRNLNITFYTAWAFFSPHISRRRGLSL